MKEYQDHYFHKAKQEHYPARSVYKLKEMDAKYRLFKPGLAVLDLGASPGSWSLYAAEKTGPKGRVLGADLLPVRITFPAQVTFMQEDVFNRSPGFAAALAEIAPFDLVMSDMAPNTTGVKFTDQCRSLELCEEALAVAELYLKTGGAFVVKIFMGPDAQDFQLHLRTRFAKVHVFKPKSSRSESKEIFYVALGFKGCTPDLKAGLAPTQD